MGGTGTVDGDSFDRWWRGFDGHLPVRHWGTYDPATVGKDLPFWDSLIELPPYWVLLPVGMALDRVEK